MNDGFAALPAGSVETLLKLDNKDLLTNVLTVHPVEGDFQLGDLRAKVSKDVHENPKTLSGDALSIKFRGNKAMIHSESHNIGTITSQTSISRTE